MSAALTIPEAFWEAVAQIELSAGSGFDPDDAQQSLEYLSGILERLSPDDKDALAAAADRLAAAEQVPERRQFFASAAEAFDLRPSRD